MENDTKDIQGLVARLEAVLFILGEAMPVKRIAAILEVTEEEALKAAKALGERLLADENGIMLLSENGRLCLATKSEHAAYAVQIAKEELDTPLSPAALETLAIVAYLGPCAKSDIDYIRGVNSSFTLRNLSVRGLCEKLKREDDPAIPQYRITGDFLRHMGVGKVEDLPSFAEYREKIYATMRNEPAPHENDTTAPVV